MRSFSIFSAALACFILQPVANAAVLHGKITDTGGAAIQGAYILAFDDQIQVKTKTPFPGKTVITSETGAFELNLAAGFYDVCVFSAGFTPTCKKVEVPKDRGELSYDVQLGVDPLIIKERGDQFPVR